MTIVPACCEARYEAIDELVSEMRQQAPAATAAPPGGDVANLLMVKVWDYLKGEPHADIETMLREQLMRRDSSEMGCCLGQVLPPTADSQIIDDARSDLNQMFQNLCKETCNLAGDQPTIQMRCSTSPDLGPGLSQSSSRSQRPGRAQSKNVSRRGARQAGGAEPITNALKNIKEAQKYDSNCAWKLHDLLVAEERITAHVKRLEARELQGIEQLQQADAMWTAMEQLYKKKIQEVEAHHATMLTKEKDIRKSLVKWRTQSQQKVRELEELRAVTIDYEGRAKEKQREEARHIQDAEAMKKQMETVKKETEMLKAEIERIKKVSQSTKVDLEGQILKLEKEVSEEKTRRAALVEEGRGSTACARENLATACRVLLQLRLEVEERRTEEETVNADVDVMKERMDACSDKCRAKVQLIRDEVDVVNEKIARYRLRCVQCHQSCSTSDVRKLCSDCPRCQRQVECLYADPTHCSADAAMSCVCHLVKEKLVENILENMYNILEANVKKTGDTLADEVLESLNKSMNGKLTKATRDRLHEYVKRTLEDNLDMCVMGGAMKTRCEMDPGIREQLDLCLKEIEETPLPTDDGSSGNDFDKKDNGKPFVVQRDSDKNKAPAPVCLRWGGTQACHCPRGPNDCDCKHAPPASASARPCGSRFVTTEMSESSIVTRDAPASCTCGDAATREDEPIACYCGQVGADSGSLLPPGGPARSPKKVSLTGCNSVKGGAHPSRKHDCSHKNSPYLSNTSSKRSASSVRKSPASRSETSTRSSSSTVEARDPHGFLCNLLSRISTSLHSFFHPPRFSDNCEPRRGRKDAASKICLSALKMGSPSSKKSQPSTPITKIDNPTVAKVVMAANLSVLPSKVVPSIWKIEPELKVDPSPDPNGDSPTRYSPVSRQKNDLILPDLKSLQSIIFIHTKREGNSTLSKTKSSRIKSSESIISGIPLSSRYSASSMKGFNGSKEPTGSNAVILLPHDRKKNVASNPLIEMSNRPEEKKNLRPQKKSKYGKECLQFDELIFFSGNDSTEQLFDHRNYYFEKEKKVETNKKILEKEKYGCEKDSSGVDKSEKNHDNESEDICSYSKMLKLVDENVCVRIVDVISEKPNAECKPTIIVNNKLEMSMNGSIIYHEPIEDTGMCKNTNNIPVKNNNGKHLVKSYDKEVKKSNRMQKRNHIKRTNISMMIQESNVEKTENYKCRKNLFRPREQFKGEFARLSTFDIKTQEVDLNEPAFLTRFHPNIEPQLPMFWNNQQFLTPRWA